MDATEFASISGVAPEPVGDRLEVPIAKAESPEIIKPAPMSRRLMAVAVDVGLIFAVFLVVAMMFTSSVRQLPGIRAVELSGALAVFVIGVAYEALCFTLSKATPGMLYAGIALCTFDGDSPTRTQRIRRTLALPLSVLPLGIGLMWALFDDDYLTWHDRLSRTYPRKR